MTSKARTAQLATLESLRLPLESYPGLSLFALDLVKGTGNAAGFLPRTPLDSLRPTGTPRPAALVAALAESNMKWGNDVRRELESWGAGRTITLVAGQQVCFAGGPLLILVKLLSLLRLRDVIAQQGFEASVFFWLATEDHDFDEVASITLNQKSGRTRLRAHGGSSRQMVGPLPVDDRLKRQLIDALGMQQPRWLREGITYGDSFAELLTEALCDRGVVFVDSMLPELRREGRDLFVSMIQEMDEAERRVTQRSGEIRDAGYTPQVAAADDSHYSFLYHVSESGVRQPIRLDDGQWSVGGKRSTGKEILAIAQQAPETISTGVLARPLLQDKVLGTDLFLGGPAEVSYYAQLAPLHEMFGIGQPRVGLRGHLLVGPQRILRPVADYDLSAGDLFRTPEEIVARIEPALASKVRKAVDASAESLEADLEQIRDTVLEADPQLDRSVGRRLARIRYHLDKLSEQGERAALRRDTERYGALSRLVETLNPDGVPQDRHIGWITFWMQYRARLVERILDEVEPDASVLKVIGL